MSKFKKLFKKTVLCVNDANEVRITKNRRYEVVRETTMGITILDNRGIVSYFHRYRFTS